VVLMGSVSNPEHAADLMDLARERCPIFGNGCYLSALGNPPVDGMLMMCPTINRAACGGATADCHCENCPGDDGKCTCDGGKCDCANGKCACGSQTCPGGSGEAGACQAGRCQAGSCSADACPKERSKAGIPIAKRKLSGAQTFLRGNGMISVRRVPEDGADSDISEDTAMRKLGGVQIFSRGNCAVRIHHMSTDEAGRATISDEAEPPAFITLSPKVRGTIVGIPAGERWNADVWRSYQGRCLSDVFEPTACPAAAGKVFGHMIAEFPKQECPACEARRGRSLILVDMPDRVRIFEHAPVEPIPSVDGHADLLRCLEDFFHSTEIAPIAQIGHVSGEIAISPEPRELPNRTHSKIETTVVTYPLRDLVLLDEMGRPVFDTCTIIDHLQAAVAPESWSHPSVSIQLDQRSVSLVIRQTDEVHAKIAGHLRYLRRLHAKQICNLIEQISGETDAATVKPVSATNEDD
jgi:hypothetical protein